jgi:peptide/nickel transport system permease protein
VSRAPLAELLAQRIPVTLELTVLAMLVAVVVGVPLGVRAATGGRWVKKLTSGFVVGGVTIPTTGIMLVLVFAGTLDPSAVRVCAVHHRPVQNLRYMALRS